MSDGYIRLRLYARHNCLRQALHNKRWVFKAYNCPIFITNTKDKHTTGTVGKRTHTLKP